MTGNGITLQWMGQEINTLRDLWPVKPQAMIIGINPAPASVAVGHYYQGNLGAGLFRRLRTVGILAEKSDGYEDDQALAVGVGFTDVVKRPTTSADQIERDEFVYGKTLLEEKLAAKNVPLIIFAFKKSAMTLLGTFQGNGFIQTRAFGGADVFVMPGPYESATTSNPTLETLRSYWKGL